MAAITPASELRELDDFALQTRLDENKEELFNLRFQSATGQLENNARLRSVRREIARLYTVMRERELGITPLDVESAADSTDQASDEATDSTSANDKEGANA